MRPSVKIRNILQYFILCILLAITLYCSRFFSYMGGEFGYKDLQYKQFPETRKFAEELSNTLYLLNSNAAYLESHDDNIMRRTIQLAEIDYQQPLPPMGHGGWITMQEFVDTFGYFYDINTSGAVQIYSDRDEYNDAWYTISLTGEQLADARRFYSISKEDYIQLLCDHASINSQYVEMNLMENKEEDTNGKAATSIPDVSYGYLDDDFSANSYVGYYDDITFVYSPDEEMFYSTLYGWYTIPDTLYFLAGDVENIEPIELLFHQFASGEAILRQKIGNDYEEYIRNYNELSYSERNIAYYMVSGNRVYTNVGSLDKLVSCNIYLAFELTGSGEYTVDFHNFYNSYLSDEYATNLINNLNALNPDDKLYIGVYTTYPYSDNFLSANQVFRKYYFYMVPALVLSIVAGALSLFMFVRIMRMCGRESKENKKIYLNFWDRLPLELMLLAVAFGAYYLFMGTFTADSVIHWSSVRNSVLIFVASYTLFMTGLLSLVRRGRARKLFDRSIIRGMMILVKKLITSITGQKNLQLRAVELLSLYWGIMLGGALLILNGMNGLLWPFMWLGIAIIVVLNIGVLILLLWQAKGEQSVRDATRVLAEGDLNYQPPAFRRLGTEQEIIDNIAHLSDGLQKAVEKSIYDERMKAELITNVSHDIKTPLTSIINYVDLIKRENIEDEKLIHYIEVLDRKSQRLKQLTEDLVEVSKITTGNIELERVPIDLGELLRQSMGEFEDKFAEHNLAMVDSISEQPYMIFADGRRTFRILDNLFQNIYKYAMPGTRVYIDVVNRDGIIVLSIKNVSRAALNIAPEELMERFVRGDSSRASEGSGLGLSIARDLVRLQDGEFQLGIDGDLFKVLITFPEFVSKVIVDSEEGEELPESGEQSGEGEVPALEKKKKEKKEKRK